MDTSGTVMSDSQNETLKQFKQHLSDILTLEHTDSILEKFLRAKNYDLTKAERNFRQVEEGRKVFGFDRLKETFVKSEVEEKYEATTMLGFAKDSTVIRYVHFGNLDALGFIMSASCCRICLFMSYIFESDRALLRQKSEEMGKIIDEITYVCDFNGWSLMNYSHKCIIEMTLDFLRVLQDCYPSIWRRVLVINAPYAFDKLFNIFKPIMKSSFRESFQVIPSGSTSEVLLKYIDEDVLPAFLGGKRTDSKGDPKCSEFIKNGGKIPEEYYLCNRTRLLMPTDPDVTAVVIGARSVYNHPLVAREAGGTFHFEHRTENGSISVSVLRKHFGSNTENIDIPSSDEIINENDSDSGFLLLSACMPAQTHLAPNIVYGKVTLPGVYIIRFDNRGSWFTSRRLIYRARLLPPQSGAEMLLPLHI